VARSRVASAGAILATSLFLGCASTPAPRTAAPTSIAVTTPFDGIPIRSPDALAPDANEKSLEEARTGALLSLRESFVDALRENGLETSQADLPLLAGKRPTPSQIAVVGRSAGAKVVVFTELVAYGDIRRSWLWILAAQGLAAGIGHGVVVAAATGNATYGWWAGAGEFALETATWVGGALIGSRGIDPVLIRVSAIRVSDGAVVARWTREGTRPLKRWFRRKGEPPRDARLRAVARRVFDKLAPPLARKLGSLAAPSAAGSAGGRAPVRR